MCLAPAAPTLRAEEAVTEPGEALTHSAPVADTEEPTSLRGLW